MELALVQGRPGAVYNFGGSAELPNIEVVRAILRATGRPETLVRHVKDRPGHDRRYAMDFSLAREELGFEPRMDFGRGLRDTLAWYEANQAWMESILNGSYRGRLVPRFHGPLVRGALMSSPCNAVVLGGQTGLLGMSLVSVLEHAGCTVRATPRPADHWMDPEALRAFFEAAEAEVVFNTWAYTQVDKAEDEPGQAMRINRDLAAKVAGACAGAGARLVHYSTDFVFNGRAERPYLEDDEPDPQCVYGRTKLAGERALAEIAPPGLLILRTAWLFGPGKGNFVHTMLDLAATRNELTVVHDQVGSPTYTPDLAALSLDLVRAGAEGLYHVVNAGRASWCELAHEAVRSAGLSTPVRPIESADWPQKAARPAFSVLDTSRFTQATGITPRPWVQAVREYVYGRTQTGGGDAG